ncbi:MAG: hypothetical protein U1F21_05565 [Sphaerotilus natans]
MQCSVALGLGPPGGRRSTFEAAIDGFGAHRAVDLFGVLALVGQMRRWRSSATAPAALRVMGRLLGTRPQPRARAGLAGAPAWRRKPIWRWASGCCATARWR